MWYPAELCSAGSDTPQDFVRQSTRSHRMLFCRVSDPIVQASAIKYTHLCYCSEGSDTPQDLVLWGLIPRRILFCSVGYLTRFCSAGYQTPLAKLRSHRIRRKSFESFPFSLKGHFSKIICLYKLHYSRVTGSMLKAPPIWKMLFCGVWHPAEPLSNLNISANLKRKPKNIFW